MTTMLEDILDRGRLAQAIGDGLIRARHHVADASYTIYNYTEKAQYERAWFHETLTCRGLIVRGAGEVIARPFPKFFNASESQAPHIGGDEQVVVTDKADGSLGILYEGPDGEPAIATRGSFHSEQAHHATELYRKQYAGRWLPVEGRTYLFEIIYPANRIVVDYGHIDDLLGLGSVSIATGEIVGHYRALPPGADSFGVMSMDEALALPSRDNREGIVVRAFDGRMVKVKQDDYVALHKIVTGLNERAVWEALRDGTYLSLAEALPDELRGWADGVANAFGIEFAEVQWSAEGELERIEALAGGRATRKEFALRDGRDITPLIWKMLEPKGPSPITKEAAA